MYFTKVTSETVIDLERVWCFTKDYDEENDLYIIKFILSDTTTVFGYFAEEEIRDNVFDTITEICTRLSLLKFDKKESNNDK